jgi:hypothetical protein
MTIAQLTNLALVLLGLAAVFYGVKAYFEQRLYSNLLWVITGLLTIMLVCLHYIVLPVPLSDHPAAVNNLASLVTFTLWIAIAIFSF